MTTTRTTLAGAAAAAAAAVAAALLAATPARTQDPAVPEPRNTRHALVIGIGEYADPAVPALKGVVHDMLSARRMARAMAVADERITVLRDHEATAERIRAEIAALQQRVADGDRVFVYFSGHGTRWYDETVQRDACTEGLLAADGRAITNVEMGRLLAPLAQRADKMLVFYDACYSGGVAGAPFRTRSLRLGDELVTPKFTRAGAPEFCAQPSNFRTRSLALVMQQAQALPQNVVHVAASRPDEVSFDSSAVGGFATVAWRDCLLGQARDLDGSGAITVDEITRCAQAKVTAALAGQPGILGQQLMVAGNPAFVPAWMGAAFALPAAAAAVAMPATAAAPATPAAPAPPSTPSATAVTAATLPAVTAPASPALTPAPAPLPAITLLALAPESPTALLLAPPAAPAATAAPASPVRPAAILAELHGQRDGQRGVAAAARQSRLRIGSDTLQLDVTPARDGYLYVALAGSDGRSLYLLYPNALDTDNRVRAGRRVTLPGPRWELVAGGPPGTETLLVMVSDAPRDLATLAQEPSGPFMRTLLDADGRARLQWVLGNGTPRAGCGRPGAPSCSDAFGSALLTVEAVP
ncbi:MAG: DUF4384 domain-containing protein [Rubrivivax sp.]|nr:DUF4384 domain-containing protein [Rubrivivax sp.]